ncbi:MAG TPA: DUF3501 family protein, partial [Burkholderiales bacterium]|nr:DUF3501 family protein [Burkholderiales bacterium]
LIPDGSNWKATFLLEYPDVTERQRALAQLKGVEQRVWARVADFGQIWAIADEDLERENEEKTAAVHFVRFELEPATVAALKQGAPLAIGVDHPEYSHTIGAVDPGVRASLVNDLAG